MAATQGRFDATHGQLVIGTGVTGRAAKMGHRLTIAMERWQATVAWSGDRPAAVTLTVDVDSLRVLHGEGGLTSLTGPEKALIRANARNCLGADKHGHIRFECDDIADIDSTGDRYRLAGTLTIRGRSKPHVVEIRVTAHQPGGSWRIEGETRVRHRDFGVRRYSMLMGAMQVADEVTVALSATVPADEIRGL